ncbi:transposable element Tc1 transposase [Trichonephila clavipes]|nr:transposable element Tc1 transposase [Trichonephila clavipes]
MNQDFSFITSIVVSGCADLQESSSPSGVQQVIHWLVAAVLRFEERFQGRFWDLSLEQSMKAVDYMNIGADQINPHMVSVFPTENGIFHKDSAPCHEARSLVRGAIKTISKRCSGHLTSTPH